MKKQDTEDLFIRSLDVPLSEQEKTLLDEALSADPALKTELFVHRELREMLYAKEAATFGPFFAARVMHAIAQSGIAFDDYLFSLFRKFRLAAAGVVVGLFALNVVFTEQRDVMSILGLVDNSTADEELVPFDFFESINENL